MRVLALLLVLGGVAHAADPKCFANPERWSYDRDKESLQQAGERFLGDLKACDPTLAASLLEVARYEVQDKETRDFVHQRGFVVWAYGVAWSLLALSGFFLWLRQRRLGAELVVLEARLRAGDAPKP
jgi:hypothetical protein